MANRTAPFKIIVIYLWVKNNLIRQHKKFICRVLILKQFSLRAPNFLPQALFPHLACNTRSQIPIKQKNFQRIHLEPGEAQELSFTIDRKHLELLDADMKWVVEPGDFVLMAGASSEDIRLNGTLTVEDYQTRAKAIEAQKPAKRVSASTTPEDAENVLDEKINTAWQGNKGDYITFALKNGAKVDKVAIAFTRDNNLPATFEIQLSGGGGQFLTVYSGTVSEYGKLISYPFKGTTASDLRIVLNDDRVSIAEVKF